MSLRNIGAEVRDSMVTSPFREGLRTTGVALAAALVTADIRGPSDVLRSRAAFTSSLLVQHSSSLALGSPLRISVRALAVEAQLQS